MKRVVAEGLKIAGRLYPFLSGRELEWATLANGRKRLVDPREDLGRAVYLARDWDQNVTAVCKRLLRERDTFMEIGGHCGLVSSAASSEVGPSGHVHVLEPQPSMAGMLAQSIERKAATNVTLHTIALSDHSGVEQMPVPYGKPTNASFSRRQEDAECSVEVTVERADTHCLNLGLDRVRPIRVDPAYPLDAEGVRSPRPSGPPSVLLSASPLESPFHAESTRPERL